MATVSVNIPDAVLPRVLDAFATVYWYNSATDGTKAAFAKAQVIRFVTEVVCGYEATLAANAARDTAVTKTTSEVIIT